MEEEILKPVLIRGRGEENIYFSNKELLSISKFIKSIPEVVDYMIKPARIDVRIRSAKPSHNGSVAKTKYMINPVHIDVGARAGCRHIEKRFIQVYKIDMYIMNLISSNRKIEVYNSVIYVP